MRTLLRLFTNKIFLVASVILIELTFLIWMILTISVDYTFIYFGFLILSYFLVVRILNGNDNPTYQVAWILILLTFPPVGVMLYLMFGERQVPRRLRLTIKESYGKQAIVRDHKIEQEIHDLFPRWERLVEFLRHSGKFPVYDNTRSTYLESGEKKLEVLLKEIEKAKNFIFIEYFIVKEGHMWEQIYEALARKVKEGVEVKAIFDDWGSVLFTKLKEQCRQAGIEVVFFNPLKPQLAVEMNNRDHRKIFIIDGKVAFVGGINIADEYINIGSKFGHWKDTAVMIEGDAVYTLTLLFIQMYSYYAHQYINPLDYKYDFETRVNGHDSFVLPYGDIPTDHRNIGLDVHLMMIYNAKDYIYIQTPYLIIGYELVQALCNAACSGVDVRIIVPGIPDKKIVNQVTKANYNLLIENGVKIYEYTPGFVHSKTVVCDDEVCTVGTINMDFRSYYLHFECNVLFIGGDIIKDCYKDVMDTIEVSKEVTQKDLDKDSWLTKLFRSLLRPFSGVM